MKSEQKERALILRRMGKSLNEICGELGISKSTASTWVRGLALTKHANERIKSRLKAGQKVAVRRNKEILFARNSALRSSAKEIVERSHFSNESLLVMVALIYWCEGAKNPSNGICFTNSDPHLMKSFLTMLRQLFTLDERKFRPVLHIHEYHKKDKQLAFWSKVTNIPIQQFTKPYLKPHTSTRLKEGYQGCLGLKYYDAKVARELMEVAKVYIGV